MMKDTRTNTLKAGAGKACVNPPRELFPFQRFLEFAFEDILDDVFARALALDNGETRFLLISLDTPPSPDEALRRRVAERFGFLPEHVMAVNTHNHSTPHWGTPRATGIGLPPAERIQKMEAYGKTVEEGIFQAVEQAVNALRPARWGFGEGDSYINVNRDEPFEDGNWMQGQNHRGPSDKTLAVLKVEDMDGGLIACVLNYCCHGTTAFCVPDVDGKIKVTPGFTGYATDYIERRYGNGAVALWTSGAAGDQNPLFSSEGFPRVYETDGYSEAVHTPPGTQYMIQKHHGYTHAIDAIRTLKEIQCVRDRMHITTAATQIQLPGQRPPEGADVMLNRLMCDNMVREQRPALCVDGKPPQRKLLEMIAEGTVPMGLHLVILGDVALVGAAAELYCEIGLQIKEQSPFKRTVVVTHTDRDNADYVLSDASAHHNVFQSFAPVRPGNSDRPILEGVEELFHQALNG